jgi:hypothetical protein
LVRLGERYWHSADALEDARQDARASGWDVQHDQNGGGKVFRKRPHKRHEAFHSTGRGADDH